LYDLLLIFLEKYFHLWNIIPPSPFPVLVGLCSLSLIISCVYFFKFASRRLLLISILWLTIFIFIWGEDISRERLIGDHTNKVQDNLKWGIILFILREALFFAAWFWAFFHNAWVPTPEIGLVWPPYSLKRINPFQLPLLNTIILLRRGVRVTLAHHKLINNKRVFTSIVLTILLGLMFTSCQLLEYNEAKFTTSDRAFGRRFFVTTGFHGIHVLVGSIFLLLALKWRIGIKLSRNHHLSIEFAIWYWHFVDVVWLFLFTFFYWWRVYLYSVKAHYFSKIKET